MAFWKTGWQAICYWSSARIAVSFYRFSFLSPSLPPYHIITVLLLDAVFHCCTILVTAYYTNVIVCNSTYPTTNPTYLTYPSSCFVVVQIHKFPSLLSRPFLVVILSFFYIYKTFSKSVAIFNIISTAAPNPVSV